MFLPIIIDDNSFITANNKRMEVTQFMPTIRIKDNGPYQVSGAFKIIDAKGNEFQTKGEISLCRCGRSENKPFCDGTHKEIHFESKPRADKKLVEV